MGIESKWKKVSDRHGPKYTLKWFSFEGEVYKDFSGKWSASIWSVDQKGIVRNNELVELFITMKDAKNSAEEHLLKYQTDIMKEIKENYGE